MRKFQSIALATSLGLSLAIAPTAQAKAKITKPSSPTISAISSSAVKKGKVNVTVTITLPTSNGGSKITGSKVSAGGKSCTIKNLKISCVIKGLKSGKSLSIVSTSKNKKGFGSKSVAVNYVAGSGNYPSPSPVRLRCTVSGSAGSDLLIGTEGDDVICGKGGADTINALGGNDTIFTDSVSDTLNLFRSFRASSFNSAQPRSAVVDSSADIINGGDGNDTIYGSGGNDTINGGNNDDVLIGDSGNDVIYGGSGNDVIYGGSDNDSLVGDLGTDLLDGGSGRNFCKIDEDDPKYLTCAGNYLELAAKKIEGRITFDASTALFKLVVQNKSSSWQNLSYEETHYAPDGDPKWGGGAGIGWLGPGQTYVGIGDWDPNGDLIAADPETGQVAYETFGVFTINSTGTQYVREDPVDPENNPQVEIQHEINPGVVITLGEGEYLDNEWVVNYTAVNNTNVSGPLTLFVQSFNQKGEMICQGSNTSVSENNRTLQANSQISGVASFNWMGCTSYLMNLRRYQISLVSLN